MNEPNKKPDELSVRAVDAWTFALSTSIAIATVQAAVSMATQMQEEKWREERRRQDLEWHALCAKLGITPKC